MTTRALVVIFALLGCGSDAVDETPELPDDALGTSGLRRSSRFEVTSSVADVFGVAPDDLVALLPEDQAGTNPFDNNAESQTVSPLVIGAYSAFAQAYATRLAADVALPERLAGCTPTAPDDRACFDELARKVGRRMFRRPLEPGELDAYATVILPRAAATGSFATAVEMLGLLFVQHPEFLYRVEREGALDDFEIATRIAFLLWGSTPDDALLDDAAAGRLQDAGARGAHAQRMLDDPKARRNWQRFHALWLGYSAAPLPPALRDDLLAETNQLIERVVFEQDAEWLALFRWEETFLSPQLATHYGLGAVGSPGWVTYPAGRGGGVLTHGSFLTLGAKFGDTSPTVRGAEIFHRLTCGSLGTIPPDVDTDMPPGDPADCKPQRYVMAQIPGCDACHGIVDKIGFGLENFGVAGAWRTIEPDRPECAIDAMGSWQGQPYAGPGELGALISRDPLVSACATTQLFRFATGRDDTAGDAPTLAALDDLYRTKPSLKRLLVTFVESRAITQRKGN